MGFAVASCMSVDNPNWTGLDWLNRGSDQVTCGLIDLPQIALHLLSHVRVCKRLIQNSARQIAR